MVPPIPVADHADWPAPSCSSERAIIGAALPLFRAGQLALFRIILSYPKAPTVRLAKWYRSISTTDARNGSTDRLTDRQTSFNYKLLLPRDRLFTPARLRSVFHLVSMRRTLYETPQEQMDGNRGAGHRCRRVCGVRFRTYAVAAVFHCRGRARRHSRRRRSHRHHQRRHDRAGRVAGFRDDCEACRRLQLAREEEPGDRARSIPRSSAARCCRRRPISRTLGQTSPPPKRAW